MSDLAKHSLCQYYYGLSDIFCAIHPSESIKYCDSCSDFKELNEAELKIIHQARIQIEQRDRARKLKTDLFIEMESLGLIDEVDDWSELIKYWTEN